MTPRAFTIPLMLALLPGGALAEVCDKERPDWLPSHGPATGLDELVYLFTSLPGLGILGAFTLAVLTGQKRYFAITALFSGLVGLALWSESTFDPTGLRALAIAEGCVGRQTLPLAACAVILVVSTASLAWLWLRRRPATHI